MADDTPELRASRLRTALDLCAFGESIRLSQLRREHPDATEGEIAALLTAWLQTRRLVVLGRQFALVGGLAVSFAPSLA